MMNKRDFVFFSHRGPVDQRHALLFRRIPDGMTVELPRLTRSNTICPRWMFVFRSIAVAEFPIRTDNRLFS